jgi:hypothetical protein
VNKQEMFDRDNGECYACGIERALTEQHRLNRKAGGRHGAAAALINRPSNRITLCWSHNVRAESSASFAVMARTMGWKLEEHEDPTKVAVYHVGFREWRLLDDDGSYTVVDGREPVEMVWEAVA